MIDLAQTIYEEKRYFFDQLTVYAIVMNPRLEGYPPAFMICKEMCGSNPCEYAVGLTFLQLNQLLMRRVANAERLSISEQLADALLQRDKTQTLALCEILGKPLKLSNLDATTRLRRFFSEPTADTKPLYYFQLTEAAA